MLAGAIPYNSISEKNHYVKKLKKKFGERLRYTYSDGFIIYQVYGKPGGYTLYPDRYSEMLNV